MQYVSYVYDNTCKLLLYAQEPLRWRPQEHFYSLDIRVDWCKSASVSVCVHECCNLQVKPNDIDTIIGQHMKYEEKKTTHDICLYPSLHSVAAQFRVGMFAFNHIESQVAIQLQQGESNRK